MKLECNLIKQVDDFSCVPVLMQNILTAMGIDSSETSYKYLSLLCDTDSSGTGEEEFQRVLKLVSSISDLKIHKEVVESTGLFLKRKLSNRDFLGVATYFDGEDLHSSLWLSFTASKGFKVVNHSKGTPKVSWISSSEAKFLEKSSRDHGGFEIILLEKIHARRTSRKVQ